MKTIEVNIVISEEDALPKTLRDVKPFVLCEDGETNRVVYASDGGRVYFKRPDDERPFVLWDGKHPHEVKLSDVFGPLRITITVED